MALEELPHNGGRVDFLPGPSVAQAIDANHADFGTIAASVVAHGGKRTRRVIKDNVPLARVVARPACESVRNAFQPLRASACCVSIIRILRVRQSVEGQYRNRRTVARARKPEPGDRRDRRNARAELAPEQRRHPSTTGESGCIHPHLVGAHAPSDMRDHITDVGDVVGPVILHGNIPTTTLRVQRRDDEPFAGAQHLEPAVAGLVC